MGDGSSLVGGIVEHLDLKEVAGVVELGDGLEQALDHVHLIEDGKLDRDARQLLEGAGRLREPVAVLEKEIDDDVTMQAVEGEP